MSNTQVLSQVAMLYKQMQEGYAIADVTISLQSTAPQNSSLRTGQDMT